MFSKMEEDIFLNRNNLDFIAQELANSHVIDNIICDLCDCHVIPEREIKNLLELQSTLKNKAGEVVSLILKGRTRDNQRDIARVFYMNGLTSVAEMFDSQLITTLDNRDINSRLDGTLYTLPNLHSSASLPSLSVTPQEPSSPSSTMSLDPPPNTTYDNLQIRVRPSLIIYGSKNHPEIYKNESEPRGYVFLSNTDKFKNNTYKERIGSNTDVENLSQLFNQMGYIVEKHINLSKGELYNALLEFSSDDEKLSKVDSCIIVVMSHGTSGTIVTADGNTVRDEDIIGYFSNKMCRALYGKPKIFIFQYCRGTLHDVGIESSPVLQTVANTIDLVRVTNTTDGMCVGETLPITTMPTFTDVYCIYASIEGHVAYLNEERGSWLVQSICAEFMENAHNTDFEKLMKMVSQRISRDFSSQEGRKQVIERSIRAFDKHLYFNPQPLRSMNLSYADSSLLNLQDLSHALPTDMTVSMDSNLSSTPPHERRARAWEAESRSSTPDILSPYDLQHSSSGVWNKSRHNSGASLGSREAISSSSGTPNGPLKVKQCEQRRFSFGSAIAENERMRKNEETCNGVANSMVDEVDHLRPKITGTAEDFRAYRLWQCTQNKVEKPTSFKRQLSAPTESEAMKKINSLERYLQINDMDEQLTFLNPIKEAINERKSKAKKKRREINTPDF